MEFKTSGFQGGFLLLKYPSTLSVFRSVFRSMSEQVFFKKHTQFFSYAISIFMRISFDTISTENTNILCYSAVFLLNLLEHAKSSEK